MSEKKLTEKESAKLLYQSEYMDLSQYLTIIEKSYGKEVLAKISTSVSLIPYIVEKVSIYKKISWTFSMYCPVIWK